MSSPRIQHLDIESMKRPAHCRSKELKVWDWHRQYVDPCLTELCQIELWDTRKVSYDLNIWWANFCGASPTQFFGSKFYKVDES